MPIAVIAAAILFIIIIGLLLHEPARNAADGVSISFVSSTEYVNPYEGLGMTITRLESATRASINTTCTLTIISPERSAYLNETNMTYDPLYFSYYASWQVPPLNGIYEQLVTCLVNARNITSSKAFHVSNATALLEARLDRLELNITAAQMPPPEIDYELLSLYVWNSTARALTFYPETNFTEVASVVNQTVLSTTTVLNTTLVAGLESLQEDTTVTFEAGACPLYTKTGSIAYFIMILISFAVMYLGFRFAMNKVAAFGAFMGLFIAILIWACSPAIALLYAACQVLFMYYFIHRHRLQARLMEG